MKQKSLLVSRNENSKENWQKYRLCRDQLAQVVKDKQEKHSHLCVFFSQHNPAKNEIYQIRGSGSINSRITALRSSFNEMITQDFKITKYFNAVFKIYGNVVALLSLGYLIQEFLNYQSVIFSTTLKQCYDILREQNT